MKDLVDLNGDGYVELVLSPGKYHPAFVGADSDGWMVFLGTGSGIRNSYMRWGGTGEFELGSLRRDLLFIQGPASISDTGSFLVDLNGDGNADDTILHVYDAVTGQKQNLKLAINPNRFLPFFNGMAAARVLGSATGDDLDGDGDATDQVVHAVKFGK